MAIGLVLSAVTWDFFAQDKSPDPGCSLRYVECLSEGCNEVRSVTASTGACERFESHRGPMRVLFWGSFFPQLVCGGQVP